MWGCIFCFKGFQIPMYLNSKGSCFLVCHSYFHFSTYIYKIYIFIYTALGEKKGRLLGVIFVLKCIHIPSSFCRAPGLDFSEYVPHGNTL